MRFCYCKDRILGVRLTRRVVKLVLLNEKYEKDSKIGTMDTGAEKIGFRGSDNCRHNRS